MVDTAVAARTQPAPLPGGTILPPERRRPPRAPGRWRPVGSSVLLSLSGWATLAATWLPKGNLVRAVVVLAFMVTCPGAAAMRWWRSGDRLERLVLAVALSVSLSILVTEGQIYLHVKEPRASIAVLAWITTLGALIPVFRSGRIAHKG